MLRQGREIICWLCVSRLMSITGCWSWQGRTSIFSPTIFRGIQRMRRSISGESPPPHPSPRGIYSQELSSSNTKNKHLFSPKIRYFPHLTYGGKMIVEGEGPQESIYPSPPRPIFRFLPSLGWWTMVFHIGLNMLLYKKMVWYSFKFLWSSFFISILMKSCC